MMRKLDVHANKLESKAILTVQCLSTCKFRHYNFLAHCQAQGKLNIHFSNTDDDGRTRPKLCASIHGQTPLTSVIERDVYAHLC